MNVMIAANSGYLFPTIVMLDSLFHSNPGAINVYLLYSDMKEAEVQSLMRFAEDYSGKKVIPIRIEEKYTQKLFPVGLSIETYYRILGMELVPRSLSRILYLDVDLVIKKSLKEFYEIDLGNTALAACKDIYAYIYGVAESDLERCEMPESAVYFNPGIMLYNLDFLRENDCMSQLLEFVYHNYASLTYMDRDALNHILQGKVKFVDWNRYNCPPVWYICKKAEVRSGIYRPYMKRELQETEIHFDQCLDMTEAFYQDAAIIHFIGETKPWNNDRVSSHAYQIFDRYFLEHADGAIEHFCKRRIHRVQLSICIITKNEKEHLETCLKSLQAYNFEIVVVDTGSTDGTKDMALTYTDAIYDFEWCNDFAAAKNYAISKAKNDFVMIIDSDEYIRSLDEKVLIHEIESFPNQVGRILRINRFTRNREPCENREWLNRIFDRRNYRYEGRIHEQVVKNPEAGESYHMYQSCVEIIHNGYDGSDEERKKKAKRNMELLLREFELHPEDTYLMYQLGKSCYMAGDYSQAVRYFELALGYDLDPKLEYVIDMVETYGYALLNCGQVETALLLESIYNEFGNSADFQFLMGLVYMNNEHFDSAVEEFLKATKHADSRATGVNSWLAYYNAGVIRECLGDVQQAKAFYRKCGKYKKARKRLELL